MQLIGHSERSWRNVSRRIVQWFTISTLLLCSHVAGARNTTFAWDAAPSWPAGTTVELEANGATATGITETQYTLDVPVQPGGVISARARAVPPAGYQCGDPLAICPPSDWATLVRTLPSTPTALWSVWTRIGSAIMTAPTFVAQYATAFNSNTSPKTAMSAVSINSGDVLVGVGAHENDHGAALAITENGSSSWVAAQGWQAYEYCETRGWTYVATANESLTVTFAKSDSYFGGNIVRFSGSSGVGSSAINTGTSGSPSVAITTTQDNSAIVVIVTDWNANSGTQTFTSNGGAGSPTGLTGYVGDSNHYGVAIAYYANAGTAGSKTVGMSAPTGQKWTIIAIEVKGTTGGGANIAPISYHRMQHGLQ